MAFLSLYSSSSKATTTPASSSSQAAAADTTSHTTPTTKQRQDRQLPARPPLAQLFNADTTLVSMNTDEPMDPSTEDDRRKSQRRRSSRADALSRRGSLSTSLHSPSPHRSILDENIPSSSASAALYENLASFTFGSHSTKEVIAPFVDPDPEDDEERMRGERAKMRAIDDGTRRPSLPSNISTDLAAALGERRPSQPINIPRPPQQAQSPIQTAPNSLDNWPVGSWPNETTQSPPESAHPEGQDASALAGFDLDFIMAPPTNLNEPRASTSNPHHNAQASFLSTFAAFNQSVAAGRRPSNVSTISDQNDTFFRHVRKNDVEYSDRRKQWSFRRRTIGIPKDKAGSPTQMWECAIAGKFNVTRCRSSRESLDGKPQPLRLLIRPYHPPASQPAAHYPPHPSVLIHKHSRANAFSIFRASKLRTTHMSASHCVLLAPLKVQVHYTETRSTRALKTYNFLDDKLDLDDKDETSSNKSERRISPGPIDTYEPVSTTSQPTAGPSNLRMSPPMALANSQSPQRAPISPLPEEDEDEEAESSVDGRGYIRTSHADAFATLDDKQLEAHRQARLSSPSEPVPIPVEVNRVRQSRFGTALKRAFNSGVPNPPYHVASIPNKHIDDINNGIFNPPWLTTAPRALQERNARTLHQLNKSFEDVGLLPHRRKPAGPPQRLQDGASMASRNGLSNGRSRQTHDPLTHGEAFEDVPDGSPVMLLPMWANEEAALEHQGRTRRDFIEISTIPINERRYLLIYYTPFAPADDTGTGANGRDRGTKKRTRSTAASMELHRSASERSKHQGEHLTSFRAVAKVLSYNDVRMSGLRLPNEGIEISPSISPNSPTTEGFFPTIAPVMSTFGDTMVIAICPSPESAIEFVPEGLDKLGLCYRPGDLPISSIADPAESERLNPVGRAIVEMAWVGCLSVMGLASTL